MLLLNRKVAWFAAILFLVAVAQDEEEEPAGEGGEDDATPEAPTKPTEPVAPTAPAPSVPAPTVGVPNGGGQPPNGGVTPPNGVPPNGTGPTPIPVPPINPPPPNGGGLPPTEPPKVGTSVKPPLKPNAKPTGTTPSSQNRKSVNKIINVAVFKESVTTGDDEETVITDVKILDEVKSKDESDQYTGNIDYSFDVWLVLMQTVNMSVHFVFPEGMKKDEPASLKQLVMTGKADMIFSSIPLLYANTSKEVEYTSPVDAEKVKVFVKTPTSETSFSSLGNVFRPVLWMTIGVAMALMAATLICIEHMGYNAKMGTYLLAPADTGQLIITILGNFCYQGAIEIASGCAGRVVIFSSLMCGYLVYISYSTLVISQLTAVKLKLPFESIEELARRKDYKLMVKNDAGLLADIDVSRKKKGAIADVWNALLPAGVLGTDVVYPNDVTGLRSLCQDNIAILTFEQRVTTQLMNRTKCSATPLRHVYFRSPKGYAMRPNFAYSDLIKRTLSRMREVGILNRWRRYWDAVYGLNQEAEKAATVVKPITLDTMFPLFGIILAGMVASVVILAFEITYKKLENAHQNRRKEKQYKMFHSKAPMPFVN